jgi:DNA polymerase elongation subunit (family B)
MNDFSKLSNEELLSLYKEKKNKEATYEAMQMALKITLNSLYGAQANEHFRYYSTDIAEGITLTGQFTIRYISNVLNEFLNKKLKTDGVDYVVANDTDSAYIRLDTLVEKIVPKGTPIQKIVDFLDKFVSTVLEPLISEKFEALAVYMNALENKMHMKREAIADRAIWRAKKNYILQVYDNEGVRYNEPKLKTVGIETARSSTPELVRKALEKSLFILLNKDENDLHTFVKEFRETFMNVPVEDIAFPRGVTDLDKWIDPTGRELWKLGAPVHVKASLVYNERLRTTGLIKKYPVIRNGDKIKFVYLKQPNPVRNNAIAFMDVFPPELEMDEYIDRELQFEKTFLEPLRSFTDIIGWQTEKVNTLMDFFSEEDLSSQMKVLTSSKESVKINKQSVGKQTHATLESFF